MAGRTSSPRRSGKNIEAGMPTEAAENTARQLTGPSGRTRMPQRTTRTAWMTSWASA